MHGDAFDITGGNRVEMDETYIGGKDRNRHWKKKSAQRRSGRAPRAGLEKLGENVGYGTPALLARLSARET
ncbi:MAG TPA: hypothetical protein VMA09_21270, partial [Candidatus Binataceae bacterium]|nr:hypothetical protein [Candidatus Binataceae bacterium]